MEKNYKVKIYRFEKEKAEINEWYEKIGSAMIRVKTFGQEMRVQEKWMAHYKWQIDSWTSDETKGEIDYVIGAFDKDWNPVINAVKTIE